MCTLTHQISDRSQSQHAALCSGVWSEHLHGSAAAVSAHCGGGGLRWPRPRCIHSGEEVQRAAPTPLLPMTTYMEHLCCSRVPFNDRCLVCFLQFFIYGGYFAVISLIFLIAGLYKVASRRRSKQEVLANSPAETESDSPPISAAADSA